MESGLDKAIRLAGGVTELARRVGVKHGHVYYWQNKRVPAERVKDICAAVDHGVTPADLRPDLYEAAA